MMFLKNTVLKNSSAHLVKKIVIQKWWYANFSLVAPVLSKKSYLFKIFTNGIIIKIPDFYNGMPTSPLRFLEFSKFRLFFNEET